MCLADNGDRLITDNMGLINMAIKRFVGFGVDYEDLFQIGSVGLIKAARAYDSGKNVRFSTYAVAKIIGEVKSYLRDNGQIKVSRGVKENKLKIERAHSQLIFELGREPRLSEIAKRCSISPEDAVFALDATRAALSLDLPPEEGGVTVGDNEQERHALDRVLVSQLLGQLEPDERRLIVLRYFCDKTQTEVSKEMGLSQVAVSRLEKKVLKKLREKAAVQV